MSQRRVDSLWDNKFSWGVYEQALTSSITEIAWAAVKRPECLASSADACASLPSLPSFLWYHEASLLAATALPGVHF